MNKKIAAAVLFVMTTSISIAEPIVTDSTSRSYSDTSSNSTTTIKSPPPTAVAPAITTINNDVCATAASGIMLAGNSKEDKEAMMEMHKRAESNFEATKKVMHDVPKQEVVMQAPMNFRSPLAEATVMPVFEAGDPTHRNSRND